MIRMAEWGSYWTTLKNHISQLTNFIVRVPHSCQIHLIHRLSYVLYRGYLYTCKFDSFMIHFPTIWDSNRATLLDKASTTQHVDQVRIASDLTGRNEAGSSSSSSPSPSLSSSSPSPWPMTTILWQSQCSTTNVLRSSHAPYSGGERCWPGNPPDHRWVGEIPGVGNPQKLDKMEKILPIWIIPVIGVAFDQKTKPSRQHARIQFPNHSQLWHLQKDG